MQLVATAHEAAAMLGSAADQLVAEAELLAQPDAALLAREEAVRRRLDDEAVDVLGADLPAEHVVRLDEHDVALSGASDSSRRAAASPAIPPPTTTTLTRRVPLRPGAAPRARDEAPRAHR